MNENKADTLNINAKALLEATILIMFQHLSK